MDRSSFLRVDKVDTLVEDEASPSTKLQERDFTAMEGLDGNLS